MIITMFGCFTLPSFSNLSRLSMIVFVNGGSSAVEQFGPRWQVAETFALEQECDFVKIAQRSSRRKCCTIDSQSDHVRAEVFEEVGNTLVQARKGISPTAPISSRAGDNSTVES